MRFRSLLSTSALARSLGLSARSHAGCVVEWIGRSTVVVVVVVSHVRSRRSDKTNERTNERFRRASNASSLSGHTPVLMHPGELAERRRGSQLKALCQCWAGLLHVTTLQSADSKCVFVIRLSHKCKR